MKILHPIALALLLAVPLQAQSHHSVLLISVDGMRPDYVTQADEHHLHIPNLRRIFAQGAYAKGVRNALPTVTYPNHTTLVTGVWPAEHGIENNMRFDPENKLNGAWYWYEDQIKTPTLWSVAHAAGLITASVGWPVTANARDIDYLIPEYWRGSSPGDAVNPDDRFLMNAMARPSGELARIEQRAGKPYMMGNDTTIDGDEIKTIYSLDILKQHRPQFMTIHLSSLDEEEHIHGPFSEEANKDLEALDGMIGRLIGQELSNDKDAVIAIVSDHGFAKIAHATNLYVPFITGGFIELGKSTSRTPSVKSWKAVPWLAGGMAAILLRDPADTATRDAVQTMLNKLAADPDSGIQGILSASEAMQLGGFPHAAFVVTLKTGYVTGGALTGPLVSETEQHGTHGYNPLTTPEMRSAFFLMGSNVVARKDLEIIDMRQIAPTLALQMGLTMPSAQETPLAVAK